MTYRANNKKAFFSLVNSSGQIWADSLEEHENDFETNNTASLPYWFSGYYLECANGKNFKSICESHPSVYITNYGVDNSAWITLRLHTTQTDKAYFGQCRNFEAWAQYSGDDSLIDYNRDRYTMSAYYTSPYYPPYILLEDSQTSSVLFFGRS